MNDFLAIIVLYKCALKDSETYNSLNNSLSSCHERMTLFVLDNSPDWGEKAEEDHESFFDILYHNDSSNPGVSAAYNRGAEVARSLGKKWLLLLDQDTCFPLDAIDKYKKHGLDEYLINAPLLVSGNVFLSPCKFIMGRGSALKTYTTGINSFKNRSLLNSGLMISLALFDKVGGYNEKIPMDFSDHDFVNRLKCYKDTFNVLDIKCLHKLSSEEQDLVKVFTRFNFYLMGAREYMRSNGIFPILWISLGRTIKLSLKFRSFIFIKYYFKRN